MSNNGKSTILVVLALLIGISGVGLGAYSAFFQQPIQGPPGQDGEDGLDGLDGEDGADAPGDIVVGILDPDFNDRVDGIVEIRALIAGSDQYSVSIRLNGTELGTQLPFEWDTSSVADGWWNITVKVIDIPSANETQDQVLVYVLNTIKDIPIYYCSNEQEINDALSDIGTGSGNVIITQSISLSASITLNGNGDYIIQGITPSITIDCGGDRSALRIEITQSCTIRDLTIDATDVSSTTTSIIFVSDTFTIIENVKILGDGDRVGYGIFIDCSNVWVTGCYISEVLYGIYGQVSGSDFLHISGNNVVYCDSGTIGHGIYIGGEYSTCDNNYVAFCQSGIYILGFQCTVSNNVLFHNLNRGIQVVTDYSTITGNSIQGYDTISIYATYGIYVSSGSDYNVLTGNLVYEYYNTGAGTGYGIAITNPNCDENTVVGNTVFNCDIAIGDVGTNSFIANNNI